MNYQGQPLTRGCPHSGLILLQVLGPAMPFAPYMPHMAPYQAPYQTPYEHLVPSAGYVMSQEHEPEYPALRPPQV